MPTVRTLCYCEQFALSLGKQGPYIFSKFNPLHTDTSYSTLVLFRSATLPRVMGPSECWRFELWPLAFSPFCSAQGGRF